MSDLSSSKASWKIWAILVISILLTAAGQLFMKASTQYLTSWQQFVDQLLLLQLAPAEQSMVMWFTLGIVSYFTSMLLWMYVLSFLKLSRIYPLLGCAYVLVYLGAVLWPRLGEQPSIEKNIGIFIIIIGVIIVSIPSKNKSLK